MSTLTVPLTVDLIKTIDRLVSSGVAANKADLARKALEYYAEEMAIQAVLQSQAEAKSGKLFRGDIDAIANAI